MIEIDVRHRLAHAEIDAAFSAGPGITALFGRSGAGKTSIINMVAGLLQPAQGRIVVDGEPLFDSERGVCLPVHRRRIGYVFQDARLFPHLTVSQNLRYGRWFRARGTTAGELERVLDLLDIAPLLRRLPAHLSGGEKQRVAIGRALLSAPKLLLMDEPLASLDERRKQDILPYIERLRDEMRLPVLYVSHALAEVARLADTIVLISRGQVEASGPPADILARTDLFPLTGRFEAGAVLECTITGHDAGSGLTRLESAAGELLVPRLDIPAGSMVRARIRARDVMLATRKPAQLSALNILSARVDTVRDDPPFAEIGLSAADATLLARITSRSLHALGLKPGRRVYAVIKATTIEHGAPARRRR
ncbi:MAG: molybdenum ABC transporter ATP-binding protein [Methyloligellaceae bacterium]